MIEQQHNPLEDGRSVGDIMWQLARPFAPERVHWRVGSTTRDNSKGIALAYIDARDAMGRLDEVVGPANWQDTYPWSDNGRLVCSIGIRLNGEWVWKSNGAGDTNVEAEKGAFSDAFKRAAVMWSVGRYLYSLPNEWMPLDDKKRLKEVPSLPEWAIPNEFQSKQERTKAHTAITRAWADKDGEGLLDIVENLSNEQQLDIWRDLNSTQRREIKELLHEIRQQRRSAA